MMMMLYNYLLRKVHRVVDGDTYDLEIDLGFYQFGVYRIRLLGYDTPEVYGRYSTPEGKEVAEWVRQWFADRQDKLITVTTSKADSFGRWLGEITCEGESLGKSLYETGRATIYTTAYPKE